MATARDDSIDKSGHGRLSSSLMIRLSEGQGRVAAGVLLFLLALFHVSAGERFWSPARNLLFDAYQRFMPRQVSRFPVVIIDIDDQSLSAIGRWPWPRTQLAQLIEATYRLGVLAVGLDMIMPEADNLSPARLLAGRANVSPAVRDVLAALPSNDSVLANTLRQIPSVIARAAITDAGVKNPAGPKQTPVLVVGESPVRYLQSYPAELTNIPEIEAAASGRGYVNDIRDGDGVVRAMPLVIAVKGALAPALAVELLRVATGQTQYSVRTSGGEMLGVQIDDLLLPTDGDGRLRLYFSPAYVVRRVSAAAILRGEVAANAMANRVAIIGATAVGVGDIAATPIAARMDGVEIQAQLIENILEGSRLKRPASARWGELLALVALALPLIGFFPRLRPIHGVAIFFTGAVALGLTSLLLFKQLHWLYDPTFPTAGNGLMVLLLLTAGFSASNRRRRELDAALEVERVERFRMAGELRAAREIQMGMLPNPKEIDGLPANVDFFAMIEPAQEVGGDLYDGVMLDQQRFFFLIGDVSGKGVPAALFMALTKTLCESLARRERVPLDELLRSVNQEIARENPAAMFVTAIVGILDTRSGEVELCNAGHNAPLLLRANQAPRELAGATGPPLCVDEEFLYAPERLTLQPGDTLLFITDGVTEAEDRQQNLYGGLRVRETFSANEPLYSATQICEKLYADVKRFTGGAPASDDITIMAVRYTASLPPEAPPSSSRIEA